MRCSVLEPIDVRTHISYHILRVYSGFLIYIYKYTFNVIYIFVCLFPIYIYVIYSSLCAEQLLIKAWTYLIFLCLQLVPRQTARCKGYFGSLPETMLSLFMSIAGGVSWQDTWCRHAVPTLQLTLDCWRPGECTPHVNCIYFTQGIPSTICTFCIMIA